MQGTRRFSIMALCIVPVLFLAAAFIASCDGTDNDTPVNPEELEGQPCKEGSFYCLGEHTMLVCDNKESVYRISEYCRSMYVDSSLDCYDMICDDQEGCVSVNSPDGATCRPCFPIPEESDQGLCRNGYCLYEQDYYADGDDDLMQDEAE